MSDDPGILLERDGGVARLRIHRPGRLNALNNGLRAALDDRLEAALADPGTRVVLLEGAGSEAFAAGADIEELVGLGPAESEALSLAIARCHARLEASAVPVVAAIRGWCLGGGFELALAADIRLADATAKFGLPEIKLGIMPGGGGAARLARVAGVAAARFLCMTGAIVDADRALALGIVSEVAPAGELEAAVEKLVRRLAGYSPAALAAIKRSLSQSHEDFSATIEAEAKLCATLFGTPEQRRAMLAFLEKRKR